MQQKHANAVCFDTSYQNHADPANLHTPCFKPRSCSTPVAVLCQYDGPKVWLLSKQLN